MELELAAFYRKIPEILIKLDKRCKERSIRVYISEKWKYFDEGFYFTPYKDGKMELSISDELKPLAEEILKNNEVFQETFAVVDVIQIISDFLRTFYVERLYYHDHIFYNGYTFEEECADNNATLNYVLDNKKLSKKQKSFFKVFIMQIWENVHLNKGIYIFPMFYFNLDKALLDKYKKFEVNNCIIYPNSESGYQEFKNDFKNASEKLLDQVKEYKEFKEKPDIELPYFAAIECEGTYKKALRKAVKKIQVSFAFLKIIIHNNASLSTLSAVDCSFKPRWNELSGMFYITEQYETDVNQSILAWSDLIDNTKTSALSTKEEFFYADNFFQYVYVSVGSCANRSVIYPGIAEQVFKDILLFNEICQKVSSLRVFNPLITSALYFTEARHETNPIQQGIGGVTSIEGVILSKATGEKGIGLTEKFNERLSNLLFFEFNNDMQKIQDFIGNKNIDSKNKLRGFLNNHIYEYRSYLVHGSSRGISYGNNIFILKIAAKALWFAIKYVYENDIDKIETFQKKLDDL